MGKKPLLIYDGDCGFCTYWVHYWQKLTVNEVDYRPYQEVADKYPTITREEFQRAVQYISPEGKIARAAEASFRTLSHAAGNSFWLSLYRWLPGFAFASEKSYALISSHRDFFFRICLFFWGRHHEPPRYDVLSWIILRAVGILFFIVFLSFGMQALGLIGSHGIIPITELIQVANIKLGAERYWLFPMVFWFNASDAMIQATCWGGLLISFFLIFNVYTRVSLFLLYALYLSLVYAGQMFMSFQWDLLIIEIGAIVFFMAGFPTLGIWLLRWLVFRFIFSGGMVKIMSADPTWRDFTALYYHFFTQPLPTPIAWYVNQFPHFILKFSTAAALFVELFIPFLILFPRRLRFISAFAILFMQTVILLTGNYNFFNITVMVICLALFDDVAIRWFTPHLLTKRIKIIQSAIIFKIIASLFAIITIYTSIIQFHLRFFGDVSAPLKWLPTLISPLQLVNTYGPFAVMTTKRMEIIIEGSNDGLNWSEYAFKYKPGEVKRPPLWNIPFQPRLDWQMWFAALSPVDQNIWFLRFMQRILENSQPVLALLASNPFPDKPPYYLRAQFYDYRFTTSDEQAKTGAWWSRELVGTYLPEVHLK